MTADLPADTTVLLAAALLAAGVLGAGFADRLRVPGLLLFLGLGMLIGDDGLGLVSFDDPEFAQAVGTVALLIILYEGGLTTKPRDVRQAALPGLLLATVGVAVTAVVVAGVAWLVLDVSMVTAFLVGAVVSSTDAAAVFTVLRRTPLPRSMRSLLEVESGANDPMAIMLTVGGLEAWQAAPVASEWLWFGVVQLGGGIIVGAALGGLGALVLDRADLGAAGMYPVLALAVAGLSYGAAAAVGASGFLAVYVTGLVVGARVPRHRRNIRTFHDGLGNTAEVGLFLMLGLLVFPSQLPAVALPGLAVAAALTLIARPLAVVVCLGWLRYSVRELGFVSWAGLRGAVPIVLATFPFVAGHPQGNSLFNMVFFVVLVSATIQGISVGYVAQWLGLRETGQVWSAVAEAVPLDDAYTELIEIDLTEDLPVVGNRLADAPLPNGARLTMIVRGPRTVIPQAHTVLQTGDRLLVATERDRDAPLQLTAWARGELDSQGGTA